MEGNAGIVRAAWAGGQGFVAGQCGQRGGTYLQIPGVCIILQHGGNAQYID